MPITIHCPGCKSTLQVADQFAGRKGRCKKCQAVFPIPAPGAPEEEPPEVLPVEQPAKADLDQGLQTTPGRVKRPVLQDDDDEAPRRQRPAVRDEEDDTPRRRRPRSVDAQPRKGAFLLVAGAVAAFVLLSAGTGTALWWFLRARPADGGAVAKPAVPAEGNPVAGAAGNAPLGDAPGGVAGAGLGAPAGDIRPPALDGAKVVRPLPANVADVAVGGGGRYLVLHLPQTRKLAIFDVNEAKITQYVALGGDQVKFTAGMTKLLVALPEQNLLQRWDLATAQRELTLPAPAGGSVSALVMGSASEGPVLMAQGEERFGRGSEPTFLDLTTLKSLPIRTSGERLHGLGDAGHWRASADGKTFAMWRTRVSPQGILTLVLTGGTARCYYEHGDAGHLLPSPDGKVIYSARGLFGPEVKLIGGGHRSGPFCLPAVHGDFYLTLQGLDPFGLPPGIGDAFDPMQRKKPTVAVHLAGEARPLLHLNDLELPEGINQWGREPFGTDKRLFLIPSAKVLVTIPTGNDRLVLHRFDLDEALDKAGIDYLLVTSRAPAFARRGADYAYQIVVKSKRGGVRYRLDSGPPGMVLSPAGRLSWRVPADFAGAADVIVSVGDASGQEVFHTFKVTPADRADPAAAHPAPVVPPAVPVAPAAPPRLTPAVQPPFPEVKPPPAPVVATPPPAAPANVPEAGAIKPPPLNAAKIPRLVGGTITDVAVGGGGRYLILHLAQQQKLAIFDVNVGSVTRYVEAPGGDVKFAAGMTKLLIYLPRQGVVERRELPTGRLEAGGNLGLGAPVTSVCMGSASEGPLLVVTAGQGPLAKGYLHFFDPGTLKPVNITRGPAPGFWAEAPAYVRASADGTVFAMRDGVGGEPHSVTVLRLRGRRAVAHTSRSEVQASVLCPSPDGRFVYACGVYSEELKLLHPRPVPQSFIKPFIPAAHGPYHARLEYKAWDQLGGGLSIFLPGNEQPLARLDDVDGVSNEQIAYGKNRDTLTHDQRVHLIPDAKLVVSIPASNDRVVLQRFDFDEALGKSGADYLLVTSLPPVTLRLGATFIYQLVVKSKKGGVTYKLDSGPPGMQISKEGRITWQVPDTWAGSEEVIISVRDAGGQEAFHTFRIANPAPRPPVAPQPPQGAGKVAKTDLPRVTSGPLPPAERNKVYTWQLEATSPAGGITFTLVTGPAGMTLSPTGKLTWSVPANFPSNSITVEISMTDNNGKKGTRRSILKIKD